MTATTKRQYWICTNSNYCNGMVRNHIGRTDCWNCGMRRDDKRRKEYPITLGDRGKRE